MGMVSEFKEFAMSGSLVDMATGIVIGGAVGKLVASLVENLIMPPIGVALGGTDFSNLGVVLQAATGEAPAVIWKWGAFVQSFIDFLIVMLVIFFIIKAMNKMKKAKEEEAGPSQEELLAEIRDALKK